MGTANFNFLVSIFFVLWSVEVAGMLMYTHLNMYYVMCVCAFICMYVCMHICCMCLYMYAVCM